MAPEVKAAIEKDNVNKTETRRGFGKPNRRGTFQRGNFGNRISNGTY